MYYPGVDANDKSMADGASTDTWAILTGLITLLLGASAVFAELQTALNTIWDVKAQPRRGFVIKYLLDRLRSFGMALGVGFLLLVSLVISATLSALQAYMNTWMPTLPPLWQGLNIVSSFFVVVALWNDLQIPS